MIEVSVAFLDTVEQVTRDHPYAVGTSVACSRQRVAARPRRAGDDSTGE